MKKKIEAGTFESIKQKLEFIEKNCLFIDLNMNDVFVPGADCESFDIDELELLIKIYRKHGDYGIFAWVAIAQRGYLIDDIPYRIAEDTQILCYQEAYRAVKQILVDTRKGL